eukprot:208173_1
MARFQPRQTMETLEDKQFLQIYDKWKDICNTQNNSRRIIRFWKQHSIILSCKGSWYLKLCILNNDTASLSVLLDDPRSLALLDKPFGYGIHHNYTPILYAARYSQFRSIQLLCSKGADIASPLNDNTLEYIFENSTIADSNVIPCVEFVVTLGCSVAANSIWCLSYYNATKQFDRVHLASFLKQHDADLIHITTAIKYGHLRLAKWLIRNKCKIYNTYLTDVKSEEGISLLIESGIQNIDHNDTVYGTALFYHSQRGNADAVRALLNHGADDALLCTKDKLSALQIAKRNEHDAIVHLLTQQDNRNENDQNNTFHHVEFSALPNNPSQLKQDIECEQKHFDETIARAVLVENKIKALQIKLKKEYQKMMELRKEQNGRNDKIEKWEASVHHWNVFIAHWQEWDISCFVEWLKRVDAWKTGSFEKYFKSDHDATNRIEHILVSDPLTFGIMNEDCKEDNVTFGKQLMALDRYTLYKIGISDTGDCNGIATEIQRLCKRGSKGANSASYNAENELCAICYEREKTHVLNCGHRFCEPDIKIVQSKSNLCPICKGKITIVIKLF